MSEEVELKGMHKLDFENMNGDSGMVNSAYVAEAVSIFSPSRVVFVYYK